MIPLIPLTRAAAVEGLVQLLLLPLCALDAVLRALRTVRRLPLGRAPPEAAKRLHGTRPTVLIVGASFAGLYCQRALSDEFDVTLVDRKDYYEYTPGVLRVLAHPRHLRNIVGPLPRTRNRFLHAEVLEAGPSHVRVRHATTGGEETLGFDFLLLGCGSSYAAPIKPAAADATLDARERTWDAAAAAAAAAQSAVVVGGGPVGVELAAELAERHPHATLTLVSGSAALCRGMPARVGAHCERWLSRRGVRVVLGARVAHIDHGDAREADSASCTLADGSVLRADVVYECTGGRAETAALEGHFGGQLDARGRLLVNEQLQLGSSSRVYAMGDCMHHRASDEAKLGHTAELNAHVVAENVRRQRRGEPLLAYPHGAVGPLGRSPRIFCVSLGKHDGALAFNSLVLTGVLPAVAKRLIEWTKVAAMAERPAGVLFWTIADWLAVALTRTLLPLPTVPEAAEERAPPAPAPEAAEEGALPAAALV